LPDRLKIFDNSLSSTASGRFLANVVTNNADVYDFYNGRIDSILLANNAQVGGANAAGTFTYNTRLGDLIGGFFD
jgi:hypothetical protein